MCFYINLETRNSNLLPAALLLLYSEHWCHFQALSLPYLAFHPNVSQIRSSQKSRHHDRIRYKNGQLRQYLKSLLPLFPREGQV